MRTGVPCNENRFFPVRISTQGKPCSGPARDCSAQNQRSLMFELSFFEYSLKTRFRTLLPLKFTVAGFDKYCPEIMKVYFWF